MDLGVVDRVWQVTDAWPYDELSDRWANLWDKLEIIDRTGLFMTVMARYNELGRAYHNTVHLVEGLRILDLIKHHATSERNFLLVQFAWWYHDIIYSTQSAGSERKSADLAKATLLKSGLCESEAQFVHDVIMATEHTTRVKSIDVALIVDADLAILGAPEVRFAQYSNAVRQEYQNVEDKFYRQARLRVLSEFAERSVLYRIPEIRKALQKRAFSNLNSAITALR